MLRFPENVVRQGGSEPSDPLPIASSIVLCKTKKLLGMTAERALQLLALSRITQMLLFPKVSQLNRHPAPKGGRFSPFVHGSVLSASYVEFFTTRRSSSVCFQTLIRLPLADTAVAYRSHSSVLTRI